MKCFCAYSFGHSRNPEVNQKQMNGINDDINERCTVHVYIFYTNLGLSVVANTAADMFFDI